MPVQKATRRRPRNATTPPDLSPPEGSGIFSSHHKITIEISSSPEPERPSPPSRRSLVGASPRSEKSLQVQIVTIASSSSRSDGPPPLRRSQRPSTKALSAAPRAPSDIIEISSDEELPQTKKGARNQGRTPGPLILGRAQAVPKKGGGQEPRRGGKEKAQAAQEHPPPQPRKKGGPVRHDRAQSTKRKRPLTKDSSPPNQTPASNLDHWTYNVQDLDPVQLEALAVVANAEAGLGVGQVGSSLAYHHVVEDQGEPTMTPIRYHPRQEGESPLDRDGDTIMMDATHTPTIGPPMPIRRDPFVEAILHLKPDLDPTYVNDLVKTYAPEHGPQTVEFVLEVIFEDAITKHGNPETFKTGSLEGEGGTLWQDSELGSPVSADRGPFLECQCCFGEYDTIRIVHCPEGHPFCLSCLHRYAEERLGSQDPDLLCMHQDGCGAPFETLQLERALSENMISLLQRTQQRQDLKKAKLEGFEGCPFCEWGCVIDTPIAESTIFICGNDGICGKISCRLCRKEHEPTKQCEELEVDSEKRARLAMEEAMSMAMIRTCPNCPQGMLPVSTYQSVPFNLNPSVSFVKEEGVSGGPCFCSCLFTQTPSVTRWCAQSAVPFLATLARHRFQGMNISTQT